MRLAPIDNPPGLTAKIANWMTARRLGKVVAPMRVVYPRMPSLYGLTWRLLQIEEKKLHLDPLLRHLVKVWAAGVNGCGFCMDIGRAAAVLDARSLEKLDALSEYATSPLFTAAERAALAYVEAVTRDLHVQDAVFEELRRHFDEREIVEITWLTALESYYNRLAIPLGLESDGLCEIATQRLAARAAVPRP
jgi:alkylhydroperoxidase family enzyme